MFPQNIIRHKPNRSSRSDKITKNHFTLNVAGESSIAAASHCALLRHLLFLHAVDALVGNVAVLTAALDLKLVTLLRGAMRAADIASGKMEPVAEIGPAPTPPPPLGLNPEPVIEPRVHLHPTPLYEPRPVIHLTPRIEQPPPIKLPAPIEIEPPMCGCGAAHKSPALPPPWSIMPWQNPVAPAPKVKVVQYRPDIISKGSLLDFFL